MAGDLQGVTLVVDEATASLIGRSRGSGSVRIVARSYDADNNQTGVELAYWAHPDRGTIPRVGDLLYITMQPAGDG